jgi:EAL domain-containing protein (putative c-di-GMP-specific phosphodiesterase class I)
MCGAEALIRWRHPERRVGHDSSDRRMGTSESMQ